MVNQSIIESAKRYINIIPDNLGLKHAYLFGSYAKGLEKPESDIDIAVVLNNFEDFFEVQMQLMRLRRNIDLRIEAHPILEQDFNHNNPFASEIINSGFELKKSIVYVPSVVSTDD
jgi:predicted nucleotidyltransferase